MVVHYGFAYPYADQLERRKVELRSLLTPFEQTVLVAWARRTYFGSPDFDLVKAEKMRRRWEKVIATALEFMGVNR